MTIFLDLRGNLSEDLMLTLMNSSVLVKFRLVQLQILTQKVQISQINSLGVAEVEDEETFIDLIYNNEV